MTHEIKNSCDPHLGILITRRPNWQRKLKSCQLQTSKVSSSSCSDSSSSSLVQISRACLIHICFTIFSCLSSYKWLSRAMAVDCLIINLRLIVMVIQQVSLSCMNQYAVVLRSLVNTFSEQFHHWSWERIQDQLRLSKLKCSHKVAND